MQKKRSRRLSGTKRFIAGLLSLVMIVSYMPTIGAMAAELPEGSEAAAEDTVKVSTNGDVDEVTTPGAEDTDVPAEGASDEGADDADVQESAEAGAADDAAAADEAVTGDAVAEEKGDETELLGNGGATYSVSITAAESVTSEHVGVNVYLRPEESTQNKDMYGLSVHPGLETDAEDAENQHRYTNSVTGRAIPGDAAVMNICVETAGNANKIDFDTEGATYLKIGETALTLTDDIKAALVSSDGYNFDISTATAEAPVDVKITLVKNENGGGPLQNPQNGQYRVDYELDETVPAGTTPVAKLQFDYPEDQESPSKIIDVTANVDPVDIPVDAGGYAPETVTVSIPNSDHQKYFQNGYIDVYSDGEYEDTICDLFDEFRKRDSEDDPYPYSYTMSIDPAKSYVFRVRFSNTRSLSWSYREEDQGRDNYVENCALYLLEPNGEGGYNEREYVDEAYSSTEPGYNSGNKLYRSGYANYQLTIGEEYKFKVVPDYGYQVKGLQINSYTIAPSEVDGEVGIFEFTMQDFNFHLNGVVEKIGNTIPEVEAKDVGYMTFNGINVGAIDYADDLGAEYDADMGGSFMISVEDEELSNDYKDPTKYADYDGGEGKNDSADAVKDMKALETISIDIDQVVSKGDEYYGYWEKPVTEFDRDDDTKPDAVDVEFVYPGEEGVDYKIAREHDGKIVILPATYKEGKLKFTTDGFSEFTILRGPSDKDNVVFDLTYTGDEEKYRLTAISGLDEIVGQTGKYTYKGAGNIVIKVEKQTGNQWGPVAPNHELKNAVLRRMRVLACRWDEDDEPMRWFLDTDNEGNTICVIPSLMDGWFPINGLCEGAIKHKVGDIATVTIKDVEMEEEMPARQVIFNDPNKKVDFSVTGLKKGGNAAENVISNVEEDGEEATVKNYGKKLYYITDDTDTIVFGAKPASAGVRIKSFIIKTVDSHPDDNGADKIVTGYTAFYPKVDTLDVSMTEADTDGYNGDYLVYRINAPTLRDWDMYSRLGVEITPVIEEVTTVKVEFPDGTAYFADGSDVGAFDVTARVGAQLYPISYSGAGEGKAIFTGEAPKDSTVVISVTSADGMNAVTSVVPADASKNKGKTLKPSKNGEYTLETKGLEEAVLTVNTEPVTSLVLTDASGEQLTATKNKYSLVHSDEFKAFIYSGSKVEYNTEDDVYELKPVKLTGVDFYNGNNEIKEKEEGGNKIIEVKDGVLTTTGDALGLAGKSLALKAKYGDKVISTTIAFSAPITKVELKEAKQGKISLPYNTTKYYNLKIDKGANQYTVRAEIVNDDGSIKDTTTPYEGGNFALGTCDGKQMIIWGDDVLDYCVPGDTVKIAFFVNGEKKSDIYEITFTDELAGKPAPTVKANDKLSTNQAIGLSLSLPKGVKASEDMYYKVVAETELCAPEDMASVEITGEKYDPGMAYYHKDEQNEEGELVRVFKQKVEQYVPVSYKTYALDVSDAPRQSEDGWYREYDVKVSVVYVNGMDDDEDDDVVERGPGSPVSNSLRVHTKDSTFETKLTLIKKAPKKIYSGECSVAMAIPKFSAATTVKDIDRIELYDAAGNGYGGWSRWDDNEDEYASRSRYLRYAEGLITLDTVIKEVAGEGENIERLDPGKYTMVVYAVAGSGVPATAKMDFTIVGSIDSISVYAPTTVYKTPGKKVTFKATAEVFSENAPKPDSKKLTWDVLGYGGYDPEGDPITGELPAALEGKVTIKNGTVTIDPKLNIGNDVEDYQFVVVAYAADYADSYVSGMSDVITITTKVRKPTDIIFRWDDYRWNDEEEQDELVGYNYSDITEANIKAGAKFYTYSIRGSQIIVYDQYGEEIEDFNVKASGVTVDSAHRVEVKKPGKTSITVTTADGTKQSKTLKFTLMYTDELFKLNTLIQDSTRDREDGWNGSFLNAVNDSDPMSGPGRDDAVAAADSVPFKSNDCASNKPIFVYVTGVRAADRDGNGVITRGDIDYHDNAMINHTLKVKSGGKITDTEYCCEENYVRYTIMPSARQTVINVTDNTVVRSADRKKTTYTYTVENSAIGAAKALKIEADKKNIINSMDSDAAEYTASGLKNPNTVTYTVTGAPQGTAYARITEDDFGKAEWVFRKALGLERDFDWEHATEAEQREYDEECFNNKTYGAEHQLTNGKFTIDYFEEWNDSGNTRYHMDRIPTGKYSFYVTIGTKSGDDFEPTALPTKVTVTVAAAPKVTAKWTNTQYKITGNEAVDLEVPTVTNGTGVRNWSDSNGGDAYWTKSMNIKGINNAFADLFETVNPPGTGPILTADQKPKLKARDGSDKWFEEKRIPIDKNHVAVIHSWYELKLLKDGGYTVHNGDDAEGWYSDKLEDSKLYVSAAAQKKAYASWIKANTTGYIEYRAVGYNGQENQLYQKITVDVEEFVDKATEPVSDP